MGLPRELLAHVAHDGVLADAIDGTATSTSFWTLTNFSATCMNAIPHV